MRTKKFIATVAVAFSFGITATAQADTQTPPVQGAIPATPVTTTTTNPGQTTTTITSSKTTELIRKFEKRTKRKVVFYWKEQGIPTPKGQKDYDPVKKGVIKVGGKFSNTWKDANGKTVRRWTKWRKDDVLVNVRRGKDKIGSYIEGTIKRCGNEKIRIYLSLKKVRKKKIGKVSEWVSKEKFVEKNAENISTNSTSTTVHTTVYVCPEGYTLNGTWCIPVSPPTKNGEQTPDNVDFVPGGKNSDPADDVSSKCKSQSTGQPVEPLSDGRCPVGSYGY